MAATLSAAVVVGGAQPSQPARRRKTLSQPAVLAEEAPAPPLVPVLPAPLPLSTAELEAVERSGEGVEAPELRPWSTFEEVRIGGPKGRLPFAALAYMVKYKGFKEPTAIQAHCWPAAIAGRDVVGVSKTGSGKTMAYLLPCLPRVQRVHASPSISFGPYVVVLAPTRELATQIEKEAKPVCKALGIKIVCLYGGGPKNEQARAVRDAADIVVATPGRLDDFASPNKVSGKTVVSLSMVTYVVLDEADCMLDLGFEPQIRKIMSLIPPGRQTLLFTATMPKKLTSLVGQLTTRPLHVRVGAAASGAAGNQDVGQRVVVVPADKRGEADRGAKKTELWRILWEHHDEACLVFCATKKTVAVVSHQLRQDEFAARGLHGDLAQADREAALTDFKAGLFKILVATDVAARGLDMKGIAVVVNYDPAAQMDDHVHRVGRTGRAGRRGLAYTILGAEDVRSARLLAEALSSAGAEVPADVAALAARPIENAKARKCAKLRARSKAIRAGEATAAR